MTARTSLWLGRGVWIALFLTVSLVLLLAGWFYYRHRVGHLHEDKYLELSAINELKSGQLQQWRKERETEVTGLARTPFRSRAVIRLLENTNSPVFRNALQQSLAVWAEASAYRNTLLVRPDGAVLLNSKGDPGRLSEATQRAIAVALTNETGVLSDFFVEPDGMVCIDALAAVRDEQGRAVALLISRTEAAGYLFPLIQSWPMPSRSAEMLLVDREGEEVLILNDLRFRAQAPLRLRRSLSETNLPSVQAVLGRQGRFKGVDHRNVVVLADLRPVPGSPWFLVAKMDWEEILAEAREQALVVAVPMAAFILLAGLGAAYGYRREQELLYRRLFDAKRRELAAHEAYRTTLYSIGDGVITTDVSGCVREMNRVAEQLTGWTEAEARGRLLEEVFQIIDETTRAKVDNPAGIVLRDETVVGWANHTVLVARDGGESAIADNAAPIRGADGVITGVVLVFKDQTAQRAARRALQQSEERLRQIVEHSAQLFYTHTPDHVMTYVSPRTREFLDCEPEDALVNWTRFLSDNPVNAEGVELTRAALETGKRQRNYQLELCSRRGRKLWVEVCESPVVVDGKVVAIVGALTDITERKEMEKRVMEALHYSRTILEHSPAGIITYRDDGAAVSANLAAARILGASIEQITAQNFRQIESWRSSGLLAAAERSLATGTEQAIEAHLVSTFGREVWLNCRFAPFEHEGRRHLVLLFNDVIEHRRAQERLRLQSTALEFAANAIIITDRRGVILWANPAFAKSSGFAADDVIGKSPRLLKSGQHDAGFYRALWDTILGGRVWHGELTNRTKHGKLQIEDTTITPVKDETGAITHFIAVKQDITQRKALEEQFRQAQKMDAFGQLAGGVAHDFNNILAVIMMQAGLLHGAASNPEDTASIAGEIGQAAKRGADLTRQLLLFSRRQTLNTSSLDLNETVANMTKMLRRIVGEHIEMEIKPASEPLWTKADAGMLDQVVMNLVVNARDAMPRGGKLRIETLAVGLDEAAAKQFPQGRPGAFVCLQVVDTGCGIPEEHLSRIFEPFFTTKEVGKGTGLGLATVFGIVQQHQGWINVTSELGRGTTFRVFLPLLVEAARPKPKAALETMLRAGRETILLVEDEKSLRHLMRNALIRLGYRVIEAASGTEALDAWRREFTEIHLLLTDMVMPGELNGKELAQQLCRERPDLKVIYVSGYSAEVAGVDLALEEGVNFLSKPFVLPKLAETLRRRLDGPDAN